MTALRPLWQRLRSIRRDQRGIAFVEFALRLPIFIMVLFAALEMTQLTLTKMKVQRLANMTADLVSQNGVSGNQLTELQMYDILEAMNVGAKPMNMTDEGRIVISAVMGVDTNNDGTSDKNQILWQRFDGGLLEAAPLLGCVTTQPNATLPNNRRLTNAEVMYHTQVTYRYEPLFAGQVLAWLDVNEMINATAAFRGRTSSYRTILTTPGYPAKDNCSA